MAGKLFLISAPSGAGKTTLVHEVIERYGMYYDLERVVTYTSKKPRVNEVPGIDYHFLSHEDFEARISQGFFMEWSVAYESYYGSPRDVLAKLDEGRSFLLIIDRVGAQQVLTHCPHAVGIWIYTKSMQDLQQRLKDRNTDSIEHVRRRLARAREEIMEEISSPIYKYHILNQDLDCAVRRIFTILKRELL
jgi:guanylate kinase